MYTLYVCPLAICSCVWPHTYVTFPAFCSWIVKLITSVGFNSGWPAAVVSFFVVGATVGASVTGVLVVGATVVACFVVGCSCFSNESIRDDIDFAHV